MKSLMILLAMIIAFSCSITAPSDPAVNYKLDIAISTKSTVATGMIVLPIKKTYTINLKTPGKIDVLYFKTCARDFTWENVRQGLSRKKATIHYTPNEIEREGACPIKIDSFNSTGKHSVGFIDFQNKNTTLPAELICNPKAMTFKGVSKCQGSVGSIKRIKFQEEVLTKFDDECEIESGRRGKSFELNIKKGYCQYVFVSVKDPSKVHRAVFYGYEKYRVRNQ